MEKFLLFLFLVLCRLTYGSDTLTRAEVYNFNVGDTFDYHVQEANCQPPPYYPPWDYRIVITGKYYSIGGDTLFYTQQRFAYGAFFQDTLMYTDLLGYEVFLDSATCLNCYNSFGFDTNSNYQSRAWNSLEWRCFETQEEKEFVSGLGCVRYDITYHCPGYFHQITQLVYYSKGLEKWGTPVSFYNSLTEVHSFISVVVYPVLNNGNFILSANIEDDKLELHVYNTLGKEVAKRKIRNGDNELNCTDLVAGIYLWELNSKSKQIGLGKIIIY